MKQVIFICLLILLAESISGRNFIFGSPVVQAQTKTLQPAQNQTPSPPPLTTSSSPTIQSASPNFQVTAPVRQAFITASGLAAAEQIPPKPSATVSSPASPLSPSPSNSVKVLGASVTTTQAKVTTIQSLPQPTKITPSPLPSSAVSPSTYSMGFPIIATSMGTTVGIISSNLVPPLQPSPHDWQYIPDAGSYFVSIDTAVPALFGLFMKTLSYSFYQCIGISRSKGNQVPDSQYAFVYLTEKGVIRVEGIYESVASNNYLHVMNYKTLDTRDKITYTFQEAYE